MNGASGATNDSIKQQTGAGATCVGAPQPQKPKPHLVVFLDQIDEQPLPILRLRKDKIMPNSPEQATCSTQAGHLLKTGLNPVVQSRPGCDQIAEIAAMNGQSTTILPAPFSSPTPPPEELSQALTPTWTRSRKQVVQPNGKQVDAVPRQPHTPLNDAIASGPILPPSPPPSAPSSSCHDHVPRTRRGISLGDCPCNSPPPLFHRNNASLGSHSDTFGPAQTLGSPYVASRQDPGSGSCVVQGSGYNKRSGRGISAKVTTSKAGPVVGERHIDSIRARALNKAQLFWELQTELVDNKGKAPTPMDVSRLELLGRDLESDLQSLIEASVIVENVLKHDRLRVWATGTAVASVIPGFCYLMQHPTLPFNMSAVASTLAQFPAKTASTLNSISSHSLGWFASQFARSASLPTSPAPYTSTIAPASAYSSLLSLSSSARPDSTALSGPLSAHKEGMMALSAATLALSLVPTAVGTLEVVMHERRLADVQSWTNDLRHLSMRLNAVINSVNKTFSQCQADDSAHSRSSQPSESGPSDDDESDWCYGEDDRDDDVSRCTKLECLYGMDLYCLSDDRWEELPWKQANDDLLNLCY